MKTRTLAALTILPLMLGACETMDGLGNSFSDLFQDGETQTAQDAQTLNDTILAAAGTETCPSIRIMNDLKQMAQFTDFTDPAQDNEISRIEIDSVTSACTMEDEAVALKIDITFDGAAGPKARVKDNDTANFSYPYFVAVTDADGKILAKEIFAASLSYGKGQDSIKQIETINQLLPKSPKVADYAVLLGFQLSEEQLQYNRTTIEPAVGEDEDGADAADDTTQNTEENSDIIQNNIVNVE